MKREGRRAPSIAAVEAEAAAFRAESVRLRDELSALRKDIALTAIELTAFGQQLKDTTPHA